MAALTPSDIRLSLQFQLGSEQISLPDLEKLVPGKIFRLNSPSETAVELICCGRCLGRARLIQVDDGLAIQVSQLSNTSMGCKT